MVDHQIPGIWKHCRPWSVFCLGRYRFWAVPCSMIANFMWLKVDCYLILLGNRQHLLASKTEYITFLLPLLSERSAFWRWVDTQRTLVMGQFWPITNCKVLVVQLQIAATMQMSWVVVGYNQFRVLNWLSEARTNTVIKVTSVLGVIRVPCCPGQVGYPPGMKLCGM